jgi:hypothetical protein
LLLVTLVQLGFLEALERVLDDNAVSLVDILLIEQVLKLVDPFLPGGLRKGCHSRRRTRAGDSR